MQAIEEAKAGWSEMLEGEKDWTASVGHKDWTASYGVFGKDVSKDVLADRSKEIAAADKFTIGPGVAFEFDAEKGLLTIKRANGDRVFTKEK
jgi:hypothetical protein